MSQLIQEFDKLGAFWQTLLGSAVFYLLLWLGRKLSRSLLSISKAWKHDLDVDRITKHWIHKYYVNTSGMYFFTQGYLFIIHKSMLYLIAALFLLVFYSGVSSFIKGDPIASIFCYFALSALWDARSWLKDHSSEESIANIDPSLTKEILEKLGDPRKKLDQQVQGDVGKKESEAI